MVRMYVLWQCAGDNWCNGSGWNGNVVCFIIAVVAVVVGGGGGVGCWMLEGGW